ncbi:MAG: RluA family pseudouridine synthase [Elusimicrobia bacterium]|nr:RluA family pseudouridine synthase [Elusimicrobiota bacterium]
MNDKTLRFTAAGDFEEGMRLDLFLAERAALSRSESRRLLESGSATIGGKTCAPDMRLRGGETVVVVLKSCSGWARPDLERRVLHEDGELLVLNKPAGLLMHPLKGNWLAKPEAALWEPEPNLAALLQGLRPGIVRGRVPRCGIVHRLDRQTSGVLLVAKTLQAYERLTGDFKERRISKVYKAIVQGVPAAGVDAIHAPVGRPTGRRRVMVTPWGRPSSTDLKVVGDAGSAALVEARPLTGRTHQIRAHLAHIGHPVVGDPEFPLPAGLPEPPRMMLHAWRIELKHPATGRAIRYQAPVPKDFAAYWDECGRVK